MPGREASGPVLRGRGAARVPPVAGWQPSRKALPVFKPGQRLPAAGCPPCLPEGHLPAGPELRGRAGEPPGLLRVLGRRRKAEVPGYPALGRSPPCLPRCGWWGVCGAGGCRRGWRRAHGSTCGEAGGERAAGSSLLPGRESVSSGAAGVGNPASVWDLQGMGGGGGELMRRPNWLRVSLNFLFFF